MLSLVLFQADGTYETRSLLIFTATRYENGEVLTCKGMNPVMQQKDEKPMRDTLTLEVLCKYTAYAYIPHSAKQSRLVGLLNQRQAAAAVSPRAVHKSDVRIVEQKLQ